MGFHPTLLSSAYAAFRWPLNLPIGLDPMGLAADWHILSDLAFQQFTLFFDMDYSMKDHLCLVVYAQHLEGLCRQALNQGKESTGFDVAHVGRVHIFEHTG